MKSLELNLALDSLKRKILSLNYSGYFTRTFVSEFKELFKIYFACRFRPPSLLKSKSNDIHKYLCLEDEVDDLLKNLNIRNIEDLKEDLEKSFDIFRSKFESYIMSSIVRRIGRARVKEKDEDIYQIDIPLWVGYCNKNEFSKGEVHFYFDINHKRQCPHCFQQAGLRQRVAELGGHGQELRGVIRLYSFLPYEQLITVFPENPPKRKKIPSIFMNSLLSMYGMQVEPECFKGNNSIPETICDLCKYNDSCHLGYETSPSNSTKIDHLDTEEVIHQLQEKCRSIVGLGFEFPVLLYDAERRFLKYKAVKYLRIPKDAMTFVRDLEKNYGEEIKNAARNLSQDNKLLYPNIGENVQDIFKYANEEKTYDFEDTAKNILSTIVQRTNRGLTEYVWETGESTSDRAGEGFEDKLLQNVKNNEHEEIIRLIIEELFFMPFSKKRPFIMTPLQHYGQKLGIIFTHLVESQEHDNIKGRKDRYDSILLRISREFAPLLFQSLMYGVYNEAIKYLEGKSEHHVPEIILRSMPKVFNVVAGVYLLYAQNKMKPHCYIGYSKYDGNIILNTYTNNNMGTHVKEFLGKHEDFDINKIIKGEDSSPKPSVTRVKVRKYNRYNLEYKVEIRSRLLIPIGNNASGSDLNEGLDGALILYFELSEFILHRHAIDIAREVGFFVKLISNAAKQKQSILKQGTRAAVAGIMGRNMSHNIGSHVFSYWAKILTEYGTRKDSSSEETVEEIPSHAIKELRDVCGIDKLFYDYLRSRMDFIAEISTGNPAWTSIMMLCGDIIYPFVSQAVLLNYLAMSENIHLESCKKLKCSKSKDHHNLHFIVKKNDDNGGKVLFEVFGEKDVKELKWKNITMEEPDVFDPNNFCIPDDVPVAIPHSVTGVHAFYSILENIIRNSAKHGRDKLKKPSDFTITIEINDRDKDLLSVDITDNLGNCSGKNLRKINGGLAERLVDPRGEIAHGNWGLKEMKISSCFLRMGGPNDIDKNGKFPPIWSRSARKKRYIRLSCKKCLKGGKRECAEPNIGYKLYLLKPKEVLLVGVDKANEPAGIFRIEENELTNKCVENGVPHRFIVTSSGDIKINDEPINKNHKLWSLLPMRKVGIEEVSACKNSTHPYYEAWLKKKYGKDIMNVLYVHGGASNNINLSTEIAKYCEKGSLSEITNNLIIYDEHGDNRKNRTQNKKTPCNYYQGVSAANPTKRLLMNLEHRKPIDVIVYELCEAARTKVLIADERIWESNRNPERRNDLEWMNIELIDLKNKRVKIADTIRHLKKFKPDFFIVHQGLLDKIDKDADRAKCDKAIQAVGAAYVISSGRGLLHTLRPNEMFLEISALERFINEDDKHGLVQVLYSLRGYRNAYV